MERLQQLNEQGKTIIMVTHENDIAAWAKRVIRMRDGHIESDERNQHRHVGSAMALTDGRSGNGFAAKPVGL
jgi:energy-coupling factor transporter ATP-binding protein EcfA2